MISAPTINRPAIESTGQALGLFTWLSPGTTLWVASCEGNFAGFVEFTDGCYSATDARGALIASYSTLGQAQNAVERATQRTSTTTMLVYVAVGTGAIALSAFAIGLSLIAHT
ncbi:hypothetical protein SAMN06295879_0122 [Agreia bicolorata]|uniref:Uncharacterized protein n=1 Tax=Agreia bicolorata TaxID=110935 RepID=A0A1T4WQZ7_9MICO|nr:hypothetical protein [Agreia bicolorata]KJC64273.1 hypothetical protein TZ00_07295 [Agreia bicolorata]SKA79773.1 hypothetical protein SAMN06295879_0122 [Agreia bicolorata]